MKLIGSLTSPYVRKVRIVLAEKKIDYEFVIDSPWEPTSSVPDHNPLGKVPVLILDDETPLYDSRVIVEYLDATAPNNRLIPAAGRDRMMVRRWEALADGTCDAAVTAFLESKRGDATRDGDWINRQRAKIARALQAMSSDLGEHAWCRGNGISLADIGVGMALGYLDFRFGDIDWRGPYPNLARLYDKLSLRAAFADTVPRG